MSTKQVVVDGSFLAVEMLLLYFQFTFSQYFTFHETWIPPGMRSRCAQLPCWHPLYCIIFLLEETSAFLKRWVTNQWYGHWLCLRVRGCRAVYVCVAKEGVDSTSHRSLPRKCVLP